MITKFLDYSVSELKLTPVKVKTVPPLALPLLGVIESKLNL